MRASVFERSELRTRCTLAGCSVEGSVRRRHWDQVWRGGGDRKTLASIIERAPSALANGQPQEWQERMALRRVDSPASSSASKATILGWKHPSRRRPLCSISCRITRPASSLFCARRMTAGLPRTGWRSTTNGRPRVHVVEWLNRNPVRPPPGRCLGCGEAEYGHAPLLPFGTEPTHHAWLHSRCWAAWHAGRKAEAVASPSLSTIGIPA